MAPLGPSLAAKANAKLLAASSHRPPFKYPVMNRLQSASLALATILATGTLPAQSPTQPVGLQPGEPYRILFVTDSTRDATSSDIADYDWFVTADANAAPELTTLNTSWRAVASTTALDARVHTGMDAGSGVPIYRPDGIRIADDYDHLFSGAGSQRYAPPNITASGATTTASQVWTGTKPNGSAHKPLGDASGTSLVGNTTATGYGWIYFSPRSQATSRPLYGVSDVLTVPYPDYPADLKPGDSFRILLVTDGSRDATSADIADYDTFVATDAQAAPAMARFVTNWRAVASTPSVDAKVHTGMDSSGGVPIYRPDGIRIADDYDHLFSGAGSQRYAPPSITASGATAPSRAWTGSKPNGRALLPLGDASGRSNNGGPAYTTHAWLWANTQPQTRILPLYAISDVITVPQPTHPQDLQPGEQYRVLLVTDAVRDATSADIADYDTFVNNDIAAQPALRLLWADWFAVVSTPSVDARTHTGTNSSGGVPIYRPDGIRIADDYDHLFSGSGSQRYAPPSITASGATTTAPRVWTGSDTNGSASRPLGAANGFSRAGSPAHTSYAWIFVVIQSQTLSRPLYAMSDVITVPYPQQTVRLGTPANPSAFIPASQPPTIGQTWQPIIDHTTFMPNATLDFVMVGWGEVDVSMMPYGTLLLSATALTLTTTPGQAFSVPIGNQPAMVGLSLSAQAASLDASPQIQLTNAIDFVIGG